VRLIAGGRDVEMVVAEPNIWSGTLDHLGNGLQRVTVEAQAGDGGVRRDSIQVRVGRELRSDAIGEGGFVPIGLWGERHLLGSQLGPNKNGRKW
jgi:Icc protein